MKLVLIDNNDEQAQTFSEKLEALGISALIFKSFNSALNHRFTSEKIIFIINDSLFRKYHDQIHLLKRTQSKTLFYILTDLKQYKAESFYSKGLDGTLDYNYSAADLLELIRKAALPRPLLWQISWSYSTKESLCWILSSLDDLNQIKEIQFSQAGFVLSSKVEFSYQEKIKFSFSFKKKGRPLSVEGYAVFRFYNSKIGMSVFEIISMNGSGQKAFIAWLDQLPVRDRLIKAS